LRKEDAKKNGNITTNIGFGTQAAENRMRKSSQDAHYEQYAPERRNNLQIR
jgi:hypothetical protein